MAQIVYEILAGTPDFLVSLNPLVAPNQTQTVIGTYSFDNIPEGRYTITIIDGRDCIKTLETSTAGYTTTTTTRYVGCDLEGKVDLTDCLLRGVAIIVEPSPCQRARGLSAFYLFNQYQVISTQEITITSLTPSEACAGAAYMRSFVEAYVDVTFTGIITQAFSLSVGNTCYISNGTLDCSSIPDGWYYTEESSVQDHIYHVVDGVITEIVNCSCILEGIINPTTTTTSTSTSTTTTTTETPTTTTTTMVPTTCCPPGYITLSNGCELIEQTPATPPAVLDYIVKTGYRTYTTRGSAIFNLGWNINGTGVRTLIPSTNAWWWNNPSNAFDGPMNRSSIWVGTPTSNQEVGLSVWINIPVTKVYYIGVGCDNYSIIKVNGVTVLSQDLGALNIMWGNPTLDNNGFLYWYIYPLTLVEGTNNIQIIGHNNDGPAGFGIQVYDATPSELIAVTSEIELVPYLLFSSEDSVGDPVYVGTNAYTCEDPTYGVALDEVGNPICVRISRYNCGEAPLITTTTTTTIDPTPMNVCEVLVVSLNKPSDGNTQIYTYNPVDNSSLYRFTISGFTAADISSSSTRIWLGGGLLLLKEYIITLSPFTATYSRDITTVSFPGAGLGITYADDINHIYKLVGSTDTYIVEYTITSNTSASETTLFNMGTGRYVSGDIMYDANYDTYLISNQDINNFYITNFDSSGNKLFEITYQSVSSNPIWGIYEYDGEIYGLSVFTTSSSKLWKITSSGLTYVATINNLYIQGSSQQVSCITAPPLTTTTTTTIAP